MVTTAPEARALTESALADLYVALEEATDPIDFLERADAIVMDPANRLALPTERGTPDPLVVAGGRGVDVDNAPSVHEYLGELDPSNAADARLWSYLALATYRPYMEARWPLTLSAGDPEAWKRRVRDRWLMHRGSVTRGRLVRHGIARLWWVAHLTYAPKVASGLAADDPHAYTREVFKSEDRLNAIFDREVGAIPGVRLAVLDHAASKGAEATDKYMHRIMMWLTLVHGYRDLGALESSAIEELVHVAATRAAA